MPHDRLGQSIAYVLLKLPWSANSLWVSGQINSPTDDLTEDEVLSFGVEGLIAEDGQFDRRPTFIAPTDQINKLSCQPELDAAIPFESRPSNYGIYNFVKAKEILSRVSSTKYGDSQ